MKSNLGDKYSPLYFLNSLGAGGLSVSFYIYLLFLIPHGKKVVIAGEKIPPAPLTTFNHIFPYITDFSYKSVLIISVLVTIAFFAFLHFKFLFWNLKEFKAFKQTSAYTDLVNSNAEVNLMSIPLTFAMTINACFVLGATFVPSLWSVVEFMFPFALIAFGVAGYYAIKIFVVYFSRIIINGDFDFSKNNNLSQMISIFAFTMVGVGMAAPGAMSHYIWINAIGIFGAIFFLSIAVLLAVLKFILGFKNMLEHGVSKESSPSLLITIPILTLIGITMIRIHFGLDHHFKANLSNSSLFTLSSIIVSLQLIVGLLGFMVIKNLDYFQEFIHSDKKSPVSFALICPGVAFFVFGMFFINFGLTLNSVVDKYSIAYFILMFPFIYVQLITVKLFFTLNKKFR